MTKRRLHTSYRFALYLLHEFRWPLVGFTTTVLGGALLLRFFYTDEPLTYLRAVYAAFTMVFFEHTLPFPREWYVVPLFFLVPFIGLGAIADSVVRLGYLIFTSKQKLQEWQVMQAAIMSDHFVVVGVGKLGYHVIKELLALSESVVAVDRKLESPLVAEVLDLGVPVVHGEARLKKTLEQAGVARARVVILATGDDLANLDAALTSRQINPDIRVVLQLFDDTLTKIAAPFNLHAISTPATSAPAFIAAAQGRSVYQSFCLDGTQTLHVADLSISANSALVGRSLRDVHAEGGVSVVMLRRAEQVLVNPDHTTVIQPEDRMVVIARVDCLAKLDERRK